MFKNFRKEFVPTKKGKIFCRFGGVGLPLVLLHGYPQNHWMWYKIADELSNHFTVIIPDLRGYGESFVLKGDKEHKNYSKREMAKDVVEVVEHFGYDRFFVAGHDRGGRVAHRLARDFRDKVIALSVLDICPTLEMYGATDQNFATNYFHWFFLIQPSPVPEKFISKDSDFWARNCFYKWSGGFNFNNIIHKYLKPFRQYKRIHASCEDYRAGASIDLEHDRKDLKKKLNIPVQVIWGKKGRIGRIFKPIQIWQKYTTKKVSGTALNCKHFVAEEKPKETVAALIKFFTSVS